MKKLFAIAIVASMFSGLYALSFGLGGQYNLNKPYPPFADSDSSYSYPAIVADAMCKPLPILGFRIGLVQYEMHGDDYGGNIYHFGTGCSAALLFYLPVAAPVNPYIPLYVMYDGSDAGSGLTFHGGVGFEKGFGNLSGYLEGGATFAQTSPDQGDSASDMWFFIQGGLRIPVGM
jgi:hypothetical protein